VADIALDADGLRRDRQRYADLLEQAEQQIGAWNERADHLQQALDGLDHLLALDADDAQDGGVPRSRGAGRRVPPSVAPASAVAPAPEAAPGTAAFPPARKAAPERSARVASARKAAARPPAAKQAPPPSTPAAPEPVGPPAAGAAEAPKGTDALRTVFEGAPERTWSLAELIEALGSRGWLPTSKRPEEGVRISLKRLAERGGVVRTDDGRWQLAAGAGAGGGSGSWPPAEAPPAPDAPAAAAAPAAEQAPAEPPPTPPSPAPEPAPVGRPVGGTVTEI